MAPTEVNGRDGLEPVRYGDWEVKGIATISDITAQYYSAFIAGQLQ